jgi:hypothetical protein
MRSFGISNVGWDVFLTLYSNKLRCQVWTCDLFYGWLLVFIYARELYVIILTELIVSIHGRARFFAAGLNNLGPVSIHGTRL